jgi:hypothetical protein
VTTDIILQKKTCPLCIELRASAVQVGFSIIYPTLLSPLSCFTVSRAVHNRGVMTLGAVHILQVIVFRWSTVSVHTPFILYPSPYTHFASLCKSICSINKLCLFSWLFYSVIPVSVLCRILYFLYDLFNDTFSNSVWMWSVFWLRITRW